MLIPNVLSIAGSDPSGGAGIQADLKTFCALGAYGMAVVTSLTAQNTGGVMGACDVPAAFVKDQIKAIFEDIEVHAVKIGMLGNAEIVEAVADMLEVYKPAHVVLDPVMVATSGDSLLSVDALAVLKTRLIPLADILTPNIPEAEKLMRKAVLDMDRSALDMLTLGSNAVLLKGGHLKGVVARDVLAWQGGVEAFESPRIDTENTHGTGCTLSSAIAVYLAHGCNVNEACMRAKSYLNKALEHGADLSVGYGHGPVHHMYGLLKHD